MAEEQTAPESDAALEQRLATLETAIRENDAIRSRTRVVSLCGMCALLILLLLFVIRIVNHFNETYYAKLKKDPMEFLQSFAQKLEITDLIKKEVDAAGVELRERILPDFTERVYNESLAALPEVQEELIEVAGRLEDYSKDEIQKKLIKVLSENIDEAFAEIKATFPELGEGDWDKNLAGAQELFVAKLHDSIELRVALVTASLEQLKAAAVRVSKTKGHEELTEANRDAIEAMLIETLLELVVYEIKPEFGAVMADVDSAK